ncbi:MAG: hypothetical protein K0S45_3690 [Nitrospira sp.]|jgi:hypothetical protein|nr:hypothetical protein [Nitrospira sp.]
MQFEITSRHPESVCHKDLSSRPLHSQDLYLEAPFAQDSLPDAELCRSDFLQTPKGFIRSVCANLVKCV